MPVYEYSASCNFKHIFSIKLIRPIPALICNVSGTRIMMKARVDVLHFSTLHENTSNHCLTVCLYRKSCNLIGWIMEHGQYVHFSVDSLDRVYSA